MLPVSDLVDWVVFFLFLSFFSLFYSLLHNLLSLSLFLSLSFSFFLLPFIFFPFSFPFPFSLYYSYYLFYCGDSLGYVFRPIASRNQNFHNFFKSFLILFVKGRNFQGIKIKHSDQFLRSARDSIEWMRQTSGTIKEEGNKNNQVPLVVGR